MSEESKKDRLQRYAREYYHRNKELCKERHKDWYSKNKEYSLQKQKENKRKRKVWAIEYLGGCCNSCKQTFHPSIYEFHHLDPTTKDRDPSKMMLLSKQKLQTELDKCQLLCANCHRLLHHKDNY